MIEQVTKYKKYIILVLIIAIISIVSINIVTLKDKKVTEEKETNKTNKKQFAMYIEDGDSYKEYKDSDKFPLGYTLNINKSKCEDINGNSIDPSKVLSSNENSVTVKSNKTIYCTLYFDNYKGTGEKDMPYKITYIEDLVDLQVAVNNGETYEGKYFELTRDLDFNKTSDYRDYQNTKYGDINGNSQDEELKTELTTGTGWKPIGVDKTNDVTNRFDGNFDGNNYTIYNLYVNVVNKHAGLFGLVGKAGSTNAGSTNIIKNLTITGKITKNGSENGHAGGIIASTSATNLILDNLHNEADVSNNGTNANWGYAGGIIAFVNDSIELINCTNSGEIISLVGRAGGIVGYSRNDAIVVNCHNKNSVKGGAYASGIMVDHGNGGTAYLLNCYNNGDVTSGIGQTGEYSTGLGCVSNGGNLTIINSYNTGTISGGMQANAGIASTDDGTHGVNTLRIYNAYNTGTVTGTNASGIDWHATNTIYENNYTYNNPATGQSFVDTLNDNMYRINLSNIDPILKDYKLRGWVLGSDGYPVFAKEVKDLSGNGRDGISFAAEWTKEGITTSNDTKLGYVYMGLENYDFDKDLAFVARVKFNKLDGYQEFFGNWDGAGGGFSLSANKINFTLYNEDLAQPGYVGTEYSKLNISPNVWYTIVGTYDNKNLKLYINGNEEASISLTGGIKPSLVFIALGQNPTINLSGIACPSYTTFSDTLIFDRALSEEEIKENYSDIPNPVNKDKLLLWYNFNNN